MPVIEPYRANEFLLEIDGIECPTVSKVSGLKLGETDMVEVIEGGTNFVRKVSSGVVKFESLTIERYMDGSEDDQKFKTFFEEMFKLSQGGQGSSVRHDIAVVKKQFGEEVFRVLVYGAWIKSASLTDLEAGSNTLFKQTCVFEHDGLEWV